MDTSITEKKLSTAYAEHPAGAPFPALGVEHGGGWVGAIMPWSETQGAIVIVSAQDGDFDDRKFGPWKDDPGATSFLDGLANSISIDDDQHPAAQACRAYRGGGHDDWQLPAHAVQTGLLANCCPLWTVLEAFKEGGPAAYRKAAYWSSTQSQFVSVCAWGQDFGLGDSYNWGKGNQLRGRAVRIILFNL